MCVFYCFDQGPDIETLGVCEGVRCAEETTDGVVTAVEPVPEAAATLAAYACIMLYGEYGAAERTAVEGKKCE